MRSSQPDAPSPATVGFGLRVVATEIPRTVKDDESNLTSAFIEILGSGGTVGTWLVSNAFPEPQSFILNGTHLPTPAAPTPLLQALLVYAARFQT